MNESLISLISICVGIISTNLLGFIYKKYSFKLIGNTILGVFGSIFFTKLISRLISPSAIFNNTDFNLKLFAIYILTSIIGAILFQITIKKIIKKSNAD